MAVLNGAVQGAANILPEQAKFEPSLLPTDQFSADINKICGDFDLNPGPSQTLTRSGICLLENRCFEIAQVASDIKEISRSERNIRLEPGKHFFLILQVEGQALIEQHDKGHFMRPGDLVLIDSEQPCSFSFSPRYGRHLSLHLPRGEVLARFGARVARGGTSLLKEDPLTHTLTAALACIVGQNAQAANAQWHLQEAIYGLLGAALHEKAGLECFKGIDSDLAEANSLALSRAFIDAHFRDHNLTIQAIARALRISTWQMQRSFSAIGTTPSRYLIEKRLTYARQMLESKGAGRPTGFVTTIAYEAGFSDLSYFHRSFRKLFGTTPGTHSKSRS